MRRGHDDPQWLVPEVHVLRLDERVLLMAGPVETYVGLPWKGERKADGSFSFDDRLPRDYPAGWPKCEMNKQRPPRFAREQAVLPPGLEKPKAD
jgi:hypothetical protein